MIEWIIRRSVANRFLVLMGIAREDFDDLRGELGDLLFQVVFYAQMAQEEGRFDFNDICAAITRSGARRHYLPARPPPELMPPRMAPVVIFRRPALMQVIRLISRSRHRLAALMWTRVKTNITST